MKTRPWNWVGSTPAEDLAEELLQELTKEGKA